ncbi:MAG: DNA ligase D [Candidatus Rokuibacteriota bacterium]|nr:MAG: DNA ligase D [Candidatus Rokubacteria bacterium]
MGKGTTGDAPVPEPLAPQGVAVSRAPWRERLESLGAPRRHVSAATQAVMLATLVDHPFSGPGWLFEIKYDGVRVLAERDAGHVKLYGRSGQDFTGRYPEIVEALAGLPVERFVLDGEVVAFDEHGRSSFQRLQGRMGLSQAADVAIVRRQVPVTAVLFDCLSLDGYDLRNVPLRERKHLLESLIPRSPAVLSYGGYVEERGEDFFQVCDAKHLEGIIAKKADGPYRSGRTRDWLKIKCQRRQEFVIGGYTDPQGARAYFGALHLGVYEGDRLVYVSKVGTGFDAKSLKRIWDRLTPLGRERSPFDSGTPLGRGHHWVEPNLVAEVRFTEWTDDGGLRHPAFLGLRDDKRPTDCRREVPMPTRQAAKTKPEAGGHVKITHADKIFWPDDGYTKGDLIAYYETIAPLMLPYLEDRPLVLVRYPDGIAGKSFFQKDTPDFVPDWVRTVGIRSTTPPRDIDYVVAGDVETLRYLANLGTIPIHLWASRAGSLERPDWAVLDLDPKGAPFTHVVRIAQTVRGILDEVGVSSYVKTSGQTGLHVLVALGARYTYDQARAFAEIIATMAVAREPKIATVARPLSERGGKVYVDFGQNGPGQTIVAPFAVRPLPAAPISCPLSWDEVTAKLDPRRFTMKTAPRRFKTIDDPLKPVLGAGFDLEKLLRRISKKREEERP